MVNLSGLFNFNMPIAYGEDTDAYIIKQIDGLDPPDQTVAIAKTASGGRYQGIESSPREIVALIELQGDNPKLLRNNLYTMLRTGYDPKVGVGLYSGGVLHSSVDAYCTRFEAALWVDDPIVQITLECLNPTFMAPAPVKYLSAQLSETHPAVYNSGTADAGFQFAIKFTDNMQHWFLRVAEDNSIGMTFDKAFEAGDRMDVSTVPGNRYILWKTQGGTVKSKMGILRDDSEWIQLRPGNNHFVVPAGTDKWQWQGPLSFTPRYWGV